jgi:hypothetical protein
MSYLRPIVRPFSLVLGIPAIFASAMACGSDDPDCSGITCDQNLVNQSKAQGGDGGAGANFGGGHGAVFNNDNGTGGAGGVTDQCTGVEAAAEALPVDMFIMLDQSVSMNDSLQGDDVSMWEGTSAALSAFVNHPAAAGLGVGIQYFGLPDACNVDAYATPDVPVGRLPGVAPAIVSSINAHYPSTLTPMAPALEGALRYMQSWAVANPERASVVVLATDGFPTQCGVSCTTDADCEAGGTCDDEGMCTPNSIAEIAKLAERYATADPPVRTFVVGIGAALANLGAIARGGGTGDAFFIESGSVENALVQAMLSIAAAPMDCDFAFPTEAPDPSLVIDKNQVDVVYIPRATGIEERIPRITSQSGCVPANGVGWYYDNNEDPSWIHVCPQVCERFAAGIVSIRVGCDDQLTSPH